MNYTEAIGESLAKGQVPKMKELVEAAVKEGVPLQTILNDGMIAAMLELGERFKREEIYLPEVLFAARAMKAGMEVLEPLLLAASVKRRGKVVLGTVQGDIHDIGKNLVGVMLRGSGFEVIDIGVDTPPDKFVETAKEHQPQIIGMSALLGTAMPMMKATVMALEAEGFKGKVKTLIGGAIVSQAFADSIGADGYAPDAARAVDKARELVG